MPRPDPLKAYIARAIEAYEVGSYPAISPIHEFSQRWGTDTERYADPSDPQMISARKVLLQHGIDVKYIVMRYMASISVRRAARLLEWLLPGGSMSNYSYYERVTLEYDRGRLSKLINDYKMIGRT